MALGRRRSERQEPLWVARGEIIQGPGSPFYARLNGILREADFDRWVEERCAPFYSQTIGRPGIAPGVYFRMQMIGYLEGIDATTLQANAALRSIVRRDTSEAYQQYLERLAKDSGIATPTREDLARLDRARPGKGSNDDWHHPHDPDAKITRMKDGRTHLAHKAEHAVDLESGAVVAVGTPIAMLCDWGPRDAAAGGSRRHDLHRGDLARGDGESG